MEMKKEEKLVKALDIQEEFCLAAVFAPLTLQLAKEKTAEEEEETAAAAEEVAEERLSSAEGGPLGEEKAQRRTWSTPLLS